MELSFPFIPPPHLLYLALSLNCLLSQLVQCFQPLPGRPSSRNTLYAYGRYPFFLGDVSCVGDAPLPFSPPLVPPKNPLNLICVPHYGVAEGAPVDEEKAEEGLNAGDCAGL